MKPDPAFDSAYANADAPSARGCAHGGETLSAACLHILGERFHRLLSNQNSFTAGQRGVRLVDHRDDFKPPALPLFPQGERFLNRLFLAGKPTGLDGLLHEGSLVRRQLDVHSRIVTQHRYSWRLPAYVRR